MEGVEGEGGEGGGVGALEKLSNKLVSFLCDCRNVQVCTVILTLIRH